MKVDDLSSQCSALLLAYWTNENARTDPRAIDLFSCHSDRLDVTLVVTAGLLVLGIFYARNAALFVPGLLLCINLCLHFSKRATGGVFWSKSCYQTR